MLFLCWPLRSEGRHSQSTVTSPFFIFRLLWRREGRKTIGGKCVRQEKKHTPAASRDAFCADGTCESLFHSTFLSWEVTTFQCGEGWAEALTPDARTVRFCWREYCCFSPGRFGAGLAWMAALLQLLKVVGSCAAEDTA
jgi:hypothetical protein